MEEAKEARVEGKGKVKEEAIAAKAEAKVIKSKDSLAQAMWSSASHVWKLLSAWWRNSLSNTMWKFGCS